MRRATPDRLFLGLAAATLGAFCLMTSMHERYAYAALVFLAPLLGRRPILAVWAILTVAISLNVAAGAPSGEVGWTVPLTGPVGTLGSIAMIIGAVIVYAFLLDSRPGQRSALDERASESGSST